MGRPKKGELPKYPNHIGTALSDTAVEKLEEIADFNNITKSAAVRFLVELGLAQFGKVHR